MKATRWGFEITRPGGDEAPPPAVPAPAPIGEPDGVGRFLRDRTGWEAIRRTLFDREVEKPAGLVGWLYTLGSASAIVFTGQIVTGVALATSYSASPDHAHESVAWIVSSPAGSLLRGLHVWGASAMVVLVVAHMLRVYFMGSYKAPRELTWMVGVGLLVLTLAMGFTGYLLPWDERSYWATTVGLRIASAAPLVGPAIAKLLRGGDEIGARTLTRFYALHVLVLPGMIGLLLASHLYLVVKHSISAPPKREGAAP